MEKRFHIWFSWSFLVTAIAIHVIFIISLGTGLLNTFFHDTQYLVGQGADFFSFYQAGNNVLNGLDCYALPDSLIVPYLYPYRYLPYFAYTFGVLLNLSPPVSAYWIWVGVVIFAIWMAVFRTRSIANALERPNWERRIGMGLWLIFSPIYIELYLGQVTLFAAVLLFFALTTGSFVNGPKSKGSLTVLWTTSSLSKFIPFLIAPVLAGAGRVWSVIIAVGVTVLAILIVPAGLASLDYFLGFNTARNMFIGPYVGSHSLKMLLYYLFGQPGPDTRAITGVLIGIFILVSSIATLYSRDVWACAGLFSLSYFFIMTDVWEHHYTFILPFFVLAWIRGQPQDKARWLLPLLVVVMSLPMIPIVQILSGVAPALHPINWAPIWQIVYHSSKVVPTLVFYLWLLVTAFRSPRGSNFLQSIKLTFTNVWIGLTRGTNPIIHAGVIVLTDDVHQVSRTISNTSDT